jgi:Skp family chaperone for outer membrane proteins
MKTRSKRLLAAVAALTVTSLLAYQSYALSRIGPARPAIIAAIDLERIYGQLDERTSLDAELQQMVTNLENQRDTLETRVKDLQDELGEGVLTPGTDQYKSLETEYIQASLDLRVLVDFAALRVDERKAKVLSDLYAKIKLEAAALAKANGYDMVLVDDSLAAMQQGNEQDITRQISARRMLYMSPEIDITDELIASMNASYGAGAP